MASQNVGDQDTRSITRPGGIEVEVISTGAAIRSIWVPTREGRRNVVLGYPSLDQYREDSYFIGATIGPYANRIANASFDMGGRTYDLDANEPGRGNCLHGGSDGLHRCEFRLSFQEHDSTVLRCVAGLADGVNGFPGNRDYEVIYQLPDPLTLRIDFRVTTDRDTMISLTNHSYFNLGGSVDNHEVAINADRYTPLDQNQIPTGEIADVTSTSLDLRQSQPLGTRAYDHNFVINQAKQPLKEAAKLSSPSSGISVAVFTSSPALQLYTGEGLGEPFSRRAGVCLEPQQFPNAPNEPTFPSPRLSKDEIYQARIEYRFDSALD